MEFTITGELGSYLVTALKKDQRLARAIARDYVELIDIQALGAYLMPPDVALDLLMARLQSDPGKTLADLRKMGDGEAVAPAGKRPRRKAARRKTAPKKSRRKGTTKKRRRMSPEEAEGVRQAILAHLKKEGWSSRADIAGAAGLSSMAVYTRLMSELRKARKVISHGSKANMVYALKGTRMPAAPKK